MKKSKRSRIRTLLCQCAVAYLAACGGCTNPVSSQGGGSGDSDHSGSNRVNDATDSGGLVVTVADERGLVTEMSRDGQRLTLDWSDDASSARVSFDDRGLVSEFTIEPDFNDEALTEALDFVEAELETDLADLRQWIATHPGAVADSVARRGMAAMRNHAVAKAVPTLQAGLPSVEDYLDGLRANVAKLAQVLYKIGLTFYQSTSEPQEVQAEYERAYRLARDRWQQAREEQQLQERECAVCSLLCQADCTTPNEGSCCRYASGSAKCLPGDAKACSDDGGLFFQSLSCNDIVCPEPGACCTSVDCLDANETLCDLAGGKFFAGESCLDPVCGTGACYTLYETSLGNACCNCRTATDSDCRAAANFHFFVRNEECPGACYVGEGQDAYCYEDSESECLKNEGATFFHESVCAGICLYESGCTPANTRECNELDGFMHFNVDSCFGACDYYDLNALEGRCVRTGGPAECNALGGSFWLGETCP